MQVEDRTHLRGPDAELRPTAAFAYTLAFHELFTNALKHGALRSPIGDVEVEWSIFGDSPERIHVLWREVGGPAVTAPERQGFAQIDLFYNSLGLWQKTAERMLMLRTREADAPGDRRFRHPDWSENAIFDFVKDSYLVAAKSILSAIREVKGMDDASARRVDFYTRQFVDALSPSNFVTTNPEALTATLESGGQNLLRGLENLLADLERGNGRLGDYND